MSCLPKRASSSWKSTARVAFTVESLPQARRRLLAELTDHHVDEEAGYDAALVLAELVSNALRHGSPLGDGGLRLTWGCWDDHLHVHVTDGGAQTRPLMRNAPSSATSGRGLSIVEAVSTSWGVDRKVEATTVWALLPTHSDHDAPVS